MRRTGSELGFANARSAGGEELRTMPRAHGELVGLRPAASARSPRAGFGWVQPHERCGESPSARRSCCPPSGVIYLLVLWSFLPEEASVKLIRR